MTDAHAFLTLLSGRFGQKGQSLRWIGNEIKIFWVEARLPWGLQLTSYIYNNLTCIDTDLASATCKSSAPGQLCTPFELLLSQISSLDSVRPFDVGL